MLKQILERVLATTTIWIDHVERSNNAELAKRSTEGTKRNCFHKAKGKTKFFHIRRILKNRTLLFRETEVKF